MSEPIIGLDLSHWQGDRIDWRKMKEAGVQWVQIKVSQDTNYQDPLAGYHYSNTLSVGILPGAYHFTTNANATRQLNNFLSAKAAIGTGWAIPDWQDCEAYTSYGGELMSVRELTTYLLPSLRVPFTFTDKNLYVLRMGAGGVVYEETYALSYPSYSVVDSIGRRLNEIAKSAIYTNPAYGNKIFGNRTVFGERYYLSLAHWYTEKPTSPTAWKGRPLLNWQRGVVDGNPYGVPGQVDYDEWQNALEFPGAVEPEPEPTEPDEIDCRVTTNKGVYSGKLQRVTNAGPVTDDETTPPQRWCANLDSYTALESDDDGVVTVVWRLHE